ncbi:FAD/NAD(P)-binding domain-containing protein [Thozetella sp. PMI_491]|nr:FAD/NAD(P)-binding domain-containing protein [Thozetella sp. PMI_491]
MSVETTDVIICGCGPTGAMLSCLLGKQGVRNIVVEKEDDITTDPRGIALDEDGIRALQGVGLYGDIYTKIGTCMGVFNFVGGIHQDLRKKPFLRMDYNTTEGGTGHVGFICHKQPALEDSLRKVLHSCPSSELRVSSTVYSIAEDDEWVYLDYRNKAGHSTKLRGKFLVAADGKTGYTRKNYLEPRGVQLQKVNRTSYEEVWVALNWKLTLPTPETHPNFPLWKLGYTPEQVYDLFFPKDFRFLCNPTRPAVCGRFGLAEDRLWRFEFVVQKSENPDEMAEPHKIKEIVYPYITHSSRRYGIAEDVTFPEDCITVLRSRPFNFMARSCNEWVKNRVILCGDAAHVFPPFGGQGITSGFRDAYGLAWRLALAVRPNFEHHQSLLRGWSVERKQQLEKSLASTVENGRFVTESSRFKMFVRDWLLAFLRLIPAVERYLEKGARKDGMVRYQMAPDVAFLRSGGFLFPQVYCVKLEPEKSNSQVLFTDDVIFADCKRSLFQLVILLGSVSEYRQVRDGLKRLEEISKGELISSEATYIVHDTQGPQMVDKDVRNLYRIATAAEFAADSELCGLRPPPKYYDEHRMAKEASRNRYVILRQDRFAFVACNSVADLEQSVCALAGLAGTR